MSSTNIKSSTEGLAAVLGAIRRKGAKLWLEDGQLRYAAPKGALTREDVEKLRASRDNIVVLLQKTAAVEVTEPKRGYRRHLDRVPLAFSQVTHFNFFNLHARPSIRIIASAIRMNGRLNVLALRNSLAEMTRRHEALRTRIVVCDGIPLQEITEDGTCELELVDLQEVPALSREMEVRKEIDKLILEPVYVTVGPLFKTRLLKISEFEHVIVVAMEHMIADGFSLHVLARDLFDAYKQAVRNRPFSWPEMLMQFADYAIWQRTEQESFAGRHSAYWSERLAECGRLRFPPDRKLPADAHPGLKAVQLRIDRKLKSELSDWCRSRQTTLVMSVFTAYAALLLRWCSVSESVIQYISDSRVNQKMDNTIGYFASTLYLRIALLETDTFTDLLARATAEYCSSYEHADFSYLASQVPPPEFTKNTIFNWRPPQGSFKIDLSELKGSEDELACSPVHFMFPSETNREIDLEPIVLFADVGDEIIGSIYFPSDRFSVEYMERFGRNLLSFVKSLINDQQVRVANINLV